MCFRRIVTRRAYLRELVPPLLLLGLAVLLLALRALRLLGSLLPLGGRLLLVLSSPRLPLLCPVQRTPLLSSYWPRWLLL